MSEAPANARAPSAPTETWHTLGAVAPRDLKPVREKLHRGVQWLARIARSYYPPEDDDSHTALTFHGPSAAAGLPEMRGPKGPVIPVYIVPEMAVALSHESEGLILGLRDLTEAERLAALLQALERVGLDADQLDVTLPYEAELPTPDDGPPDAPAAVELTRYYANFALCLQQLDQRVRCVSPVRLWPHHFDLARLIALDDGPQHEDSRSIGVGLAPDDGAYDQPYLYIAPWPPGALPADHALPPAPAGLRWHTGDFTALVAAAEEIMLGEGARDRVDAAIDAGVALCRRLLLETTP